MVSDRIEDENSHPQSKPAFRELISIDSDSDGAATPRSKPAVAPGTYANAPKHASAYIPNSHSPHISIESNGYTKANSVNVAAQGPTDRQLEKMPAITTDINEVFENQSVTTTADREDEDREEDDDKTLFDESFPEIGDDALLNSGRCRNSISSPFEDRISTTVY